MTETLTETTLLAGATATITLMTAKRMAEGMAPEAAFQGALDAFIALCTEAR